MKDWVTSRGIVRATKEIELQRWIFADRRAEWRLDICAYGEWWEERFERKLDAYRMLKERWRVSWAFWRELCRDAREIREVDGRWVEVD